MRKEVVSFQLLVLSMMLVCYVNNVCSASDTPRLGLTIIPRPFPQMHVPLNENAWKIVNVIEQVPLPVAAATHDLLNSKGFSNVSVRQAVPRTN